MVEFPRVAGLMMRLSHTVGTYCLEMWSNSTLRLKRFDLTRVSTRAMAGVG